VTDNARPHRMLFELHWSASIRKGRLPTTARDRVRDEEVASPLMGSNDDPGRLRYSLVVAYKGSDHLRTRFQRGGQP
jgi:hypothetical protein